LIHLLPLLGLLLAAPRSIEPGETGDQPLAAIDKSFT
jgi:hypothetical protein